MEEFYSGYFNLWDEYTNIVQSIVSATGRSVVQKVHETSKRNQFLMKLRPEFEYVHSNLINRDPVPSLVLCLGDILHEE